MLRVKVKKLARGYSYSEAHVVGPRFGEAYYAERGDGYFVVELPNTDFMVHRAIAFLQAHPSSEVVDSW